MECEGTRSSKGITVGAHAGQELPPDPPLKVDVPETEGDAKLEREAKGPC